MRSARLRKIRRQLFEADDLRLQPSSLLNGLVSYWKFDEASGNLLDAVGTNHMTDTNSVTSAAGKVGTSREFTAVNDEYFTIADNATLRTGDIDFEFAGWLYLDSSLATEIIFSKDGATREYSLLYTSAQGKLSWYIFNGGNNVVQSDALNTGQWYFVGVWHDSVNNKLELQIDRGTIKTTNTTIAPASADSAFIFGDDLRAADRQLDGKLDEWGFWKQRLLSSAERDELYNGGLGNTHPFTTRANIIFDGDSLTSGTGATTGNDYPSQCIRLLGVGNGYVQHNFGVGSQTTPQMLSDVATQTDVLFNALYRKNIYVLWGGVNDLLAGVSANDVYANLTSLISGRKAAGFSTRLLTVTKASTLTAPQETQRQALNALILANAAGADSVIDVAAHANLQNTADATYFSDGVHLTDAGYAIPASMVAATI